jgi:hypothetical protein
MSFEQNPSGRSSAESGLLSGNKTDETISAVQTAGRLTHELQEFQHARAANDSTLVVDGRAVADTQPESSQGDIQFFSRGSNEGSGRVDDSVEGDLTEPVVVTVEHHSPHVITPSKLSQNKEYQSRRESQEQPRQGVTYVKSFPPDQSFAWFSLDDKGPDDVELRLVSTNNDAFHFEPRVFSGANAEKQFEEARTQLGLMYLDADVAITDQWRNQIATALHRLIDKRAKLDAALQERSEVPPAESLLRRMTRFFKDEPTPTPISVEVDIRSLRMDIEIARQNLFLLCDKANKACARVDRDAEGAESVAPLIHNVSVPVREISEDSEKEVSELPTSSVAEAASVIEAPASEIGTETERDVVAKPKRRRTPRKKPSTVTHLTREAALVRKEPPTLSPDALEQFRVLFRQVVGSSEEQMRALLNNRTVVLSAVPQSALPEELKENLAAVQEEARAGGVEPYEGMTIDGLLREVAIKRNHAKETSLESVIAGDEYDAPPLIRQAA